MEVWEKHVAPLGSKEINIPLISPVHLYFLSQAERRNCDEASYKNEGILGITVLLLYKKQMFPYFL